MERKLPNELEELWNRLPERYQSIYGFEDSYEGKRPSHDRLEIIRRVVKELSDLKGRRLKILDIGASQGFFSVGLALDGNCVTAIDHNLDNVLFVQGLADYYSIQDKLDCQNLDINDFIKSNSQEYDLVLCFSVLHHEYWKNGAESTRQVIDYLRRTCAVGIYELALKDEPLYWSASLPTSPLDDFMNYVFIDEIASVNNHLSDSQRPIFLVSDKFMLIEESLTPIHDGFIPPHPFVDEMHRRRRAFLIDGNLLKFEYSFPSINHYRELENEYEFLSRATDEIRQDLDLPTVACFSKGSFVSRLTRTFIPGKRIDQVLNATNSKEIESAVLIHLRKWAKHGLYPNDLRPWNVIVQDDARVSYIDYGRSSDSCNDANGLNCIYALLTLLLYIRRSNPKSFTLAPEEILSNLWDLEVVDLNLEWTEGFFEELTSSDFKLLQLISHEDILKFNTQVKRLFTLTQERDELTQERDELTQERDELTQQRDELTQQRDELTQQRDELTQQRDEIVHSTIWKWTNPLRKVIDLFKK